MTIPTPSIQSNGQIPERAIEWIRAVFAGANRQVTETLSRNPTHHEPELDMQLIAALNQAPPVTDVSGWTVYIQTHFLGGRRHFYNWEVADIGLLVIFRDRGKVLRIKVGLLQSKRLYSWETFLLPNHRDRFRMGFASLLENPDAFRALAAGRTFAFEAEARYLAIENGSEQMKALSAYSKMSGIPVYYLLYNPVRIPWSATIPTNRIGMLPEVEVGSRVVPATTMHSLLESRALGYHPTYADLSELPAPFIQPSKAGWSLEHFVADELVRCKEGHVAGTETDHALEQLFYNRSGPISSAIAVTIEAPEGVEFDLPRLER